VLQTPDRGNRPLPRGTTVLDVFDETGRALLILGEPGSGKTMALLELARTTLAWAEDDPAQPIPVVFNLSSWAEKRRGLTDWLVDELNAKYQVPKEISRTWLEDDELLLLLDGLDEVSPSHRAACVSAINRFRQDHGFAGIIVCCRRRELEALPVRLNLQGAVCLQPLTSQQIDEYLAGAGQKLSALRSALRQDTVLQELSRSPLMLSVMSLVYQDAPATVLSAGDLDSLEARRRQLFATYVARMFRRRKPSRGYTAKQTSTWLTWLARGMIQHSQSLFRIEALQPSWLTLGVHRWLYAISSRLLGTVLVGLALATSWIVFNVLEPGLSRGPGAEVLIKIYVAVVTAVITLPGLLCAGLVVALIDGVCFARDYRTRALDQAHTPQIGRQIVYVLVIAAGSTLGFGVVTFLVLRNAFVLLSPVLGGCVFGLLFGLRKRRSYVSEDIRTVETLIWSWRRFVVPVLVGAILGSLTFVAASVGIKRDPGARLWDWEGHLIAPLDDHTIRFSLDAIRPYEQPPIGFSREVVFSSDGSQFLTADPHDGRIWLWDSTNGSLKGLLQDHMDEIGWATFSPNGKRLVAVDHDGAMARLWDMESGLLVGRLEQSDEWISSISFSSDGTRLVTSGCAMRGGWFCDGGSTWLWSGTDGTFVARLQTETGWLDAPSFNSDGTRLLQLSQDGTVWLWNGQDGALVARLGDLPGEPHLAQFSPDGSLIATAGEGGPVHLWKSEDGTFIRTLEGTTGEVLLIRFSPDGARLATVECTDWRPPGDLYPGPNCISHTTRLWNGMDGTAIAVLSTTPNDIGTVRFSQNGTRLVAIEHALSIDESNGSFWYDTSTVRLWNGLDGTPIAVLTGHMDDPDLTSLSPDGTRVITFQDRDTAQLWDVADGTLIATIQGYAGDILLARFSPDGTRLAVVERKNLVQLWNAVDGTHIQTLEGHRGQVWGINYDPSSARIVTVSNMTDKRYLSVLWLALGLLVGLFGGLYPGIRDTKTFPNQGIRLSARNALVIGLAVALSGLLLLGLISTVIGEPGLVGLSLPFGLLAALWYGGLDVLEHMTLRVILGLGGKAPWNYARFLDQATERVFLRKVGGGYIFVHRLLMEHFAARWEGHNE
jgi:WD40 repeat protein